MAIIHADTGDGFKRTVQASLTRVIDHDQWSVTIQTEGISDEGDPCWHDPDIVICAGEGIVRYRIAFSNEEIVQMALSLPRHTFASLGDIARMRAENFRLTLPEKEAANRAFGKFGSEL